MKKFVFLLLFAVACQHELAPTPPPPGPPKVSGPKLPFVDEGMRDPSFIDYRERLLIAVRAHDAKTVAALSDPKIRTSFGESGGSRELQSLLTRHPDVFDQLERILTLGGSYREGMFWAPYVYSTFPDSHDAFMTLAVIDDDVPLRAEPDAHATVIAILSRDLVSRESDADRTKAWTQVKTADGKTGWVETKLVRSPVDYRAGFAREANGNWRMNALVAGD